MKKLLLNLCLAGLIVFGGCTHSSKTAATIAAPAPTVSAPTPPPPPPAPATNRPAPDPIAFFRDEGTNRSQVAEILTHLTDVIGPRLTASPNCRRANEWTRDKLSAWGLSDARLEAWGPFGRGWSVQRFSAQIIEPQCIPLVAWPKAWSHGVEKPIVAPVVFLDAKNEADLEKYQGKLKGCIALVSTPRDVPIPFEPLATRLGESNLLRLANAPVAGQFGPGRGGGPPRRTPATNAPPATNEVRRDSRAIDTTARLRFAVREGAALTITISSANDGLSVGDAQVVGGSSRSGFGGPRSWATNAPAGPPQLVLFAEQYNRLAHLLQSGESVKMAVEVQTQFHDRDLMCYNTLAEIPGTDRKDELVMLGAHLDSLAGGTGGADNAAGVTVCLEAVRLIKALNVPPRRTIRVALWTGEEQGLMGSRAYVSQHFGYYTNQPNSTRRALVRQSEYDRLSAYYNLDYGSGRVRGIYLQGNEPLRPYFRRWLTPFRDLDADTVSAANVGSTDHISFDAVGLPGLQFIQDPLQYWSIIHTSRDVRERDSLEDLKQAAIIMAACVYQTAMLDEKLPRKTSE